MSLLMDYLPEWYSSNVNQPKKSHKHIHQQQKQLQESVNPTKLFYILKDDDQLNLDDSTAQSYQQKKLLTEALPLSALLPAHVQEFDLIKQNRIRNDLLNLLTQQPSKFVPYSMPDTFNCTKKQKGFHRDPFDCTKYYFCSDVSQPSSSNSFLFSKATTTRIDSNVIQVKAYTCPNDTVFNMNGCYCEKETSQNANNCHYLSDTYCDFALFKNVEKKFS